MKELATALVALEKPLLVLLGALAGGLMVPLTDRLRARTMAGWWEAQERWRFKAKTYTRALTAMKRMRQPLEVAATIGVWPDPAVWGQVNATALDLIQPTVVSRIWLTKEAAEPLETLGSRILELMRERDKGSLTEKQILMKLCEMIEADIEALQQVAQKDLRLRLETDK